MIEGFYRLEKNSLFKKDPDTIMDGFGSAGPTAILQVLTVTKIYQILKDGA